MQILILFVCGSTLQSAIAKNKNFSLILFTKSAAKINIKVDSSKYFGKKINFYAYFLYIFSFMPSFCTLLVDIRGCRF